MIHHWKCKLTEERVEEIYIELREGTISQDIADMFGVSRGLIDHVNHGRAWAFAVPIRIVAVGQSPIEEEFSPVSMAI